MLLVLADNSENVPLIVSDDSVGVDAVSGEREFVVDAAAAGTGVAGGLVKASGKLNFAGLAAGAFAVVAAAVVVAVVVDAAV